MQKKKINSRGFSLVELIIVIAIMAVLVGVLAPQYLKYVERAKRTRDAHSALEMRNTFDRILATDSSIIYSVGSGSAYRRDTNNYVAVLSADGSDTGYTVDPLLTAVMDELGTCPKSATFKNGMWAVEVDKEYCNVVRIELIELTDTGPHWAGGKVQGYEVWPSSHDFCSCSEPTDSQIYNNIRFIP